MEQVLDAREEQIQWRTGASASLLRSQRPNLPVIPLPLPTESLEPFRLNQIQARKELCIAPDHAVVLWLGRLSLLTKLIPGLHIWCWSGLLVSWAVHWCSLSVAPTTLPPHTLLFEKLRDVHRSIFYVLVGPSRLPKK